MKIKLPKITYKLTDERGETLDRFMKSIMNTKVNIFNKHLELVNMMVNNMLDEEVNSLSGTFR